MTEGLGLVVPDVDIAVVQGGKHPRLRGVQAHAFDPVAARGQLPLDV